MRTLTNQSTGRRWLHRAPTIVLLCVVMLAGASCSSSSESTSDAMSASEGGTTMSATSTTVTQATTTSSETTTSEAATRTGCDSAHEPGEYEGVGVFGDIEQPYWIVVPDTYASNAPVPLYVNLASGGGSHDIWLDGWRPYLDGLDGLMVMVNTSKAQAVTSDALVSLIDQISTQYCVDPDRVHVMGTAFAAVIAENLACGAAERIASFAAGPNIPNNAACDPIRPVPLLTLTGDPDRTWTTELIERWVPINGCDSEPAIEDLGNGVSRISYQSCDADILFYDFAGMPHCFVFNEAKGPSAGWICEYDEFDWLQDSLEFFAEHPLP